MAAKQPTSRHWATLNAAVRHPAGTLGRIDIPPSPGVYAWYRRGRAIYVGKADSLQLRLWRQHLGQSASLRNSAFRRNVAEFLGLGAAADIYSRRVRLDLDQLRAVRQWIMACSVAWVECSSEPEAVALEEALKAERLPRLTKR